MSRREDDKADPGTVLAQSPGGGGRASRGATVTLTVAKEPAAKRVPDVTGAAAGEAEQTLTAAGFRVTQVEQTVTDPAEDGVVLSQDPSGSAPAGSTVTLTVGRLAETTTTTAEGGA